MSLKDNRIQLRLQFAIYQESKAVTTKKSLVERLFKRGRHMMCTFTGSRWICHLIPPSAIPRNKFTEITLAEILNHLQLRRNTVGAKALFNPNDSSAYDALRWWFEELVMTYMEYGYRDACFAFFFHVNYGATVWYTWNTGPLTTICYEMEY